MPLTKVTSGAITDSAITTAKIEDGTIVNADISASANIAQSKLSLSLPTISSITIQDSQGAIPPSDTSLYFDIIGTNFTNPSTVELLDSSTNASTNATTVTYVSATQLRVTASLSAGTYKIKVTRNDGFAGISATALLTVSQAVSWSTSAGSLGTFDESVAISTITLSATSNSSVTYAVQSGSLPTGLSLNTSNGEITGTPSAVDADTTSTFTVRATDAESQYADREFTITVTNIVIAQSLRFNDDDGAKLRRTPASASNRKTWTWSCWFKLGNLGVRGTLFSSYGSTSNNEFIDFRINADGTFAFSDYSIGIFTTTQLFRDVSAWYHMVVALDTTQATASDRLKLYVNGTQVTDFSSINYPTQNTDLGINLDAIHDVGNFAFNGNFPYDGYLAEMHLVDGQALTASSFGETGSNGRWKPKAYSGTYGTNGFYLDFSNSSNFGEDQSGNNNDFTATNLAATDQATDTPQNNFATLNPLDTYISSMTLSEGNLKSTGSDGAYGRSMSTIGVTSGKWYCEAKIVNGNDHKTQVGVIDLKGANLRSHSVNHGVEYRPNDDIIYSFTDGTDVSNQSGLTGISNNDIVGIALNADASPPTVQFYVNGSALGSAVNYPVTDERYFFYSRDGSNTGSNAPVVEWNFGNPSFSISSGNSDDNGYGNFEYAPPSGHLALCTNNLSEPTIKDSSEYFNTVLYTGTGVDPTSRTGVGFQPDWIWAKERSSNSSHRLIDSSRGNDKVLISSQTDAELTRGDIQSFDSDGFTTDDGGAINESGQTYVAWNWKANGGTTSTNTDGTITSTVQANTTSGFSIVSYTGTGSAGTVGHGLGSTVAMVITKSRDSASAWQIYHKDLGKDKTCQLNETAAAGTISNYWGTSTPDSTVFGVIGGGYNNNLSGEATIAYCFAEIPGFSHFGTYTGINSAVGPFVNVGFKPAWVMVKRVDDAYGWCILDNKRDTYNVANQSLFANLSNAEDVTTGDDTDFLSNGFKQRNTGASNNASSGSYIYMAFAESPFGGTLTAETTAR